MMNFAMSYFTVDWVLTVEMNNSEIQIPMTILHLVEHVFSYARSFTLYISQWVGRSVVVLN